MSPFGVVCLLVLSINVGVMGQEFGFEVNSCTMHEVSFSVLNGVNGGVTFIEGVKNVDDPSCLVHLNGSANQTVIMHFDRCEVETLGLNNGSSISFVIIVQEYVTAHIKEDPRIIVTCHFASTITTIELTILSQSDAVEGFTPVTHTSSPQPIMELYDTTFNTPINRSEPVIFGTPLRVKISLSMDIPNYDLIIQACSIAAKKKTDGQIIGNVVQLILDECTIVEFFENFVYLAKQAVDSDGIGYDVPYAENVFQAFTPFLPGVKFTYEEVLLTLTCTVNVCVFGSDECVKKDCTAQRRKRQADEPDDHTNSTTYDLYKMYLLRFGNEGELINDEESADEPTIVSIGKDDMCMDRLAFWGALLTLLALLVAAWLALCCFFIFVRRRRRRESRTVYIDDKASTKESIITPVEVNIVEKPVKTVPFVLPRYHPADFAVETVETVETRELA